MDWNKRVLHCDDVKGEELYDYQADPLEKENLIEKPAYAAAAREMRALWDKYRKEHHLQR